VLHARRHLYLKVLKADIYAVDFFFSLKFLKKFIALCRIMTLSLKVKDKDGACYGRSM